MAKDNNFDEEEVKTEASFKTVTFGGYDKNSVDYYIEELKADHEKEVNELKANVNKLSEAVLSLKTMREVNLTESNKTMVMEQILNYTNRDLSFTVVFDTTTDTPELTSMTFDKVYSLGEKMGKAGMNTLMGMGTVFVILILISIIIYAFRIIPYLQNKKKNAADATVAKEDKVVEQIAQKEELVQDDLELVAVISAAIAAATGSSTDGFVVRSIKRR